jgi:hypothetical protein
MNIFTGCKTRGFTVDLGCKNHNQAILRLPFWGRKKKSSKSGPEAQDVILQISANHTWWFTRMKWVNAAQWTKPTPAPSSQESTRRCPWYPGRAYMNDVQVQIYLMWAKQCHLHHLPVITIFTGGMFMYVYDSQSWVVCGLPVPVPARPVAAPCATCPKGFFGGWAGYLTAEWDHWCRARWFLMYLIDRGSHIGFFEINWNHRLGGRIHINHIIHNHQGFLHIAHLADVPGEEHITSSESTGPILPGSLYNQCWISYSSIGQRNEQWLQWLLNKPSGMTEQGSHFIDDISLCVYVSMYLCIYVCVYVCMYVCM